MPGIIVDIGTGDGSFVYALAKKYPDRMIIGIDPNQQALEQVSRKTTKKPAKGGLKNTLFVLSNAFELPVELHGLADQVFINFPWGSLLAAVIQADKQFWENLKRSCKQGTIVDILVGYEKKLEIKELQNFPQLNLEFFKTIFSPQLEQFGFRIIRVQRLNSQILKKYPSTWAKKLSFANPRDFYYVRLKLK